MTDENRAHAVHIDRRHQSAPKETEADKAVRLAAAEIDEGKWRLDQGQQLEADALPTVALRAGTAEYLKSDLSQADYDHTENSLMIAEHPRVQEALRNLEEQRVKSTHGQEYVEKSAMIQEMIQMRKQKEKWDGQGRWIGKENEEMRYGQILTPMQFYDQLMRVGFGLTGVLSDTNNWPVQDMDFTTETEMVFGKPQQRAVMKASTKYIRTIGRGPILLTRDVSRRNPQAKSGRVALVTLATERVEVLLPGQEKKPNEPIQICTLQWPFSTEWMVMNFDEWGVPTTQKFIGWRTALLTLVRSNMLTIEQAHKAFPVGSGEASGWYSQQLFEWSNGAGRPQ